MAVLPIRISGDPILHQPADDVTDRDASLSALVDDMFETMDKAPGVGLAGPQVGVPLRVFVYDYPDVDGTARRGVAINPTLWVRPTPIGEPDPELEAEGCLSFPGERFPLRRSEAISLRATDLSGKEFEIHATGWFARIFQHEFDHLNGILYVDRLSDAHSQAAGAVARERGWGVPGQSWLPGVDKLEP